MSNKTQLQINNTELASLIEILRNSNSGTGEEIIYPNGTEWTQSYKSDNFYSIYNANGIWVAGGYNGLYYSTDGKTWTHSNINNNSFNAVYNANGIWVAGGYNGLYYSVSWEDGSSTNSGGMTPPPLQPDPA